MDTIHISVHCLALFAIIACVTPLISFLVVPHVRKGAGQALALVNISISFLVSVFLFSVIWNGDEFSRQVQWFQIGAVQFTAGILLNNLSVLMLMLVSGISLLVHIYSVSYMRDDPAISRYWAYLGLFCFSMLSLVIVDNLLLIYMFWELVGFASYLLIGFWVTRPAASQAAKKAFIINRLGDLGFLCGLFIIYAQFGTFDVTVLFGNNGLAEAAVLKDGFWINGEEKLPSVWLTAAGIAFFIGAMSKSAQFPFHTWLPDAMEGPTSVSSLIHAATMVAAGVFLIARVYPIFDTNVLSLMAVIGTLTALMAAAITLTQYDIKRILAFSTISQLGFMIMGMGIGAYGESLFHLSTHAFFKCLLFLAAGAVIHQLHHLDSHTENGFDHQDIRNMGGFRKRMRVTFACFCIASMALAGLPFSSGFLSKDVLIISSFEWAERQSGLLTVIPYFILFSSWLTVFYISRLIFKVFFGDLKVPTLREAPLKMRGVMIILALASTFLIFSLNPVSSGNTWILGGFMESKIASIPAYHLHIPLIVTGLSLVIITLTYIVYVKRQLSTRMREGFFYNISKRELYFNELYSFMLVAPLQKFSLICKGFDRILIDGFVNLAGKITRLLAAVSGWFDETIIDGFVNLMAGLAAGIGNFGRSFQSGKLQHYFVTMLAVLIVGFILTYLI